MFNLSENVSDGMHFSGKIVQSSKFEETYSFVSKCAQTYEKHGAIFCMTHVMRKLFNIFSTRWAL